MLTIPLYLKKGDTIGVVCPAGYMPKEKAAECIRVLQQDWGFKVKVGETLGSDSTTYFSGTDEQRCEDLQRMMDDNEVNAILCGRGGYGTGRIIDMLNFKKFRQHPKWIIGFSDVTVLHSHLLTKYKIASLHAPMAAAFNDAGYISRYVQSLKHVLYGEHAHYGCEVHEFNKHGEVSAPLVGGNLALLTHLTGTKSEIKTKNRILFLEDIGEQLYNVDRMMYQLKRAGKLKSLAALVIGHFSEMKDTDRPFGKNVYEIIRDIVKEYDYPVCYNFPVSHDAENYALKIGITYHLHVGRSQVSLKEVNES